MKVNGENSRIRIQDADPDLHQNVMDPQHCLQESKIAMSIIIFTSIWLYPWWRSGTADPCLWQIDPDPLISPLTFKMPTKNSSKKKHFFLLIAFWRYKTSHKIKGIKVFQLFLHERKIQSWSLIRTNGSGSGRPNIINIRWIRIRNTGIHSLIC